MVRLDRPSSTPPGWPSRIRRTRDGLRCALPEDLQGVIDELRALQDED
jgi:hypothetical protein